MSAKHRIPINEQLTLDLTPGSKLVRLAQLSPHELLREVQRALSAAQERTSLISDWCERFVDLGDRKARANADALFVSYYSFCEAAGTPEDDRLGYQAFGAALDELGLEEKVDGERVHRVGIRLLRRRYSAPMVDPEPMVDEFLASQCDVTGGVRTRIRSKALHAAYNSWAQEHGAASLTLRRMTEALRYRGFDKLHSDGIYWLSITLREEPHAP